MKITFCSLYTHIDACTLTCASSTTKTGTPSKIQTMQKEEEEAVVRPLLQLAVVIRAGEWEAQLIGDEQPQQRGKAMAGKVAVAKEAEAVAMTWLKTKPRT